MKTVYLGGGSPPTPMIAGPAGASGSVMYNGDGVPSNTLGNNGDYYLNNVNQDYYYKTAGAWSKIGNFDGIAGSQWYTGSGAPSGSLGVNNDMYLDTTTQNVWQKQSGTWAQVSNIKGATGSNGTNGTNGTSSIWRTGSGVPSDSLGNNSDMYLDIDTDNVYIKTAGVWVYQVNIKGLTGSSGTNGTNGSQWFSGAGVPDAGSGVNGDFYLRTTNSDVYCKQAGTWNVVTNIKGASGTNGASSVWLTGSGAPSAGTGNNSDMYLDTAAYNVYQKASGSWTLRANIKGANGSNGSSSVWLTGSGAPSAGTGNNSDMYLDTAAYNVYQKISGSWTLEANIKGATGATGPSGSGGTSNYMFGRGYNSALGSSLGIPAAGAYVEDGTGVPIAPMCVPIAGTIKNVAIAVMVANWTSANLKLYQNGSLVAVGALTGSQSGGNLYQVFTGLNISLAAGDYIMFEITNVSGGGHINFISVVANAQ